MLTVVQMGRSLDACSVFFSSQAVTDLVGPGQETEQEQGSLENLSDSAAGGLGFLTVLSLHTYSFSSLKSPTLVSP